MRSTTRPAAGSGNSRNGTTGKTVLTDVGAVDLAVPRDRNGSFEPQIVRKGQTRLEGFNDRIIALYARGMTTRDIRAHLREMYDVDVSPDLISPGHRRGAGGARRMAVPAAGSRLPGDLHRRADGQDQGRGGRQPAGLPGDRDRLRRAPSRCWACGSGPPPGSRPSSGSSVLSELQGPGRGRCVHRVLRRADRAARRDRRDLAAGRSCSCAWCT